MPKKRNNKPVVARKRTRTLKCTRCGVIRESEGNEVYTAAGPRCRSCGSRMDGVYRFSGNSKPVVTHSSNRNQAIHIYTDGSCLVNPNGPGGWAFVAALMTGNAVRSGHDPCTTNNRMEVMAVLEALRYAATHHHGQPVEIYTDSEYVRCACEKWLDGWKTRGWKRAEGPLLNKELWKEVYEARAVVNARFIRVPGHSGHALNELCDQYAGDAARGRCVDQIGSPIRKAKMVVYEDYEESEPMSSFTEDVLV